MYSRRMTKALLYCRVSTDEQVENGVSLDAQEQALALEAMRRGYEFEIVREEGKSGKSLEGRDKLAEALDLLDKHKADVLMAVRMDRLSRNVGDVATLMARSKRRGWGIILSGDKLDTTADGKFRTCLDAALAERRAGHHLCPHPRGDGGEKASGGCLRARSRSGFPADIRARLEYARWWTEPQRHSPNPERSERADCQRRHVVRLDRARHDQQRDRAEITARLATTPELSLLTGTNGSSTTPARALKYLLVEVWSARKNDCGGGEPSVRELSNRFRCRGT